MVDVTTTDAVRFRIGAHGLDVRRPATTPLTEVATTALPDYPRGSARRALAARRAGIDAGTLTTALAVGELGRAPSLRGTAHVFAARDSAVYTTGILPRPGDEAAARAALGSAWPPLEGRAPSAVEALDRVRDEIAAAVADGRPRTKGEISEALHGRLPEGWEPWCARCRADHVPDLLFRLAAVAAGLRFTGDAGDAGDRSSDDGDGDHSGNGGDSRRHGRDSRHGGGELLVAGPRPDPGEHAAARAELVRRFLAAYAPAPPRAFAEWCGLAPAEARASFAALGDDVVDVRLDGAPGHALARDVDRLQAPPPVHGLRLVPAGDAFLHQRDRATLVADPAHRKALWRPVGAPGLVLLDGVPAGVWRPRRAGRRLQVTVDPWTDQLTDARARHALDEEAAVQAAAHGLSPGEAQVQVTA